MKAIVYNGPRDVEVKEMPDPTIEHPCDVIVKVTTTNICGSDLHMYEGRTDLEPGKIIGHENLGEIVECGPAVAALKQGDRVCVPFNAACGFCKNCERGLTAACLTLNPGTAGAGYGYAGMGDFQGGQAEYLRVPYGDFNCLKLPEDAAEKEADYVMLADIFPTGWHATELAGLQPGESVVIYGAGPVGLMAAYSAQIKGAGLIMVVDRHPDRLALARECGAIAIDDSKDDPVARVLELTRLRVATGQTSVKAYNRRLCQLIELGKAKPSFIVSHQLPLEEAPDAYKHFDARENGWTKVVLRPHERATTARGASEAKQHRHRQPRKGQDGGSTHRVRH